MASFIKGLHGTLRKLSGLLAVVMLISCGSSGGGDPGTTTVTRSLGTSVDNVPLQTGVPVQIKFSYTHTADINARGDYSINLSETLKKVSLSSTPIVNNDNRFETFKLLAYALIKDAFAMESAEVTAYISYAGDPEVCSSPYVFGPYTITGAIGSAITSTVTDLEPSQAAIDISNQGAFDVCLVATPPIDGYVTITDVVVDFDDCAPAISGAEGIWSGTYQCDNFGVGDDPPGTVSLVITRQSDGSYEYMDDGGAIYNGHICGNTFRFSGGLAGDYSESGTMILNGTDASKTSNWLSVNSSGVGGRCTDSLQKM